MKQTEAEQKQPTGAAGKLTVTVIGCGRWGSLIAWYLAGHQGHRVTLYGRPESPHMRRFLAERRNDLLTLPDSVRLSTDIRVCAEPENQVILISVGAQGLRALLQELRPLGLHDVTVVLCMKGIEADTGLRLSQVAAEFLDPSVKIAVWVGPGHVQEFYAGVPNCMVIDSEDQPTKRWLVDAFSSDLIRFYYGEDLIGSEIGAAAKNVIGIAAGMLDGMGLSSLKGALMSRGTREVSRLIAAMGGNGFSAYGLCHLGDYEATVFSQYSHNRRFGEMFVRGEPYTELAEGYDTVKALCALADRYHVDLPIGRAVYAVLYDGAQPKEQMNQLFTRSLKREFDI